MILVNKSTILIRKENQILLEKLSKLQVIYVLLAIELKRNAHAVFV